MLPRLLLRPRGGGAASAAAPLCGSHYGGRSLFGQSFEVGEIRSFPREATGSRDAQWARANKLIPGIVYGYNDGGGDKADLVYVNDADLRKEVTKRGQSFYNTLFDIVGEDGTRHRVLPRDFQIHPFRPKAICINWLRYRVNAYPGSLIDIPLKVVNEERCPGLKEGGWLLELTPKVRPGKWDADSVFNGRRPPTPPTRPP